MKDHDRELDQDAFLIRKTFKVAFVKGVIWMKKQPDTRFWLRATSIRTLGNQNVATANIHSGRLVTWIAGVPQVKGVKPGVT